MIEINSFLEMNKDAIKSIIEKFDVNREFSSHDFIEEFSAQFERDYIKMLVEYQDTGIAFQTVHGIIAKFLSINSKRLSIEKTQRKGSENVHGKIDNIQWWIRIK